MARIRLAVWLGLVVAAMVLPQNSVAASKAAVTGAHKGAQRTAAAKDAGKALSYTEIFPATKLAPATEKETAALREASAAYGKRDYAKAVSLLTPLAEGGSARAAFSLGLMAVRGHGMPMSTEKAEWWWVRSAKGGFPEAQYHLGLMHHQALRGARDPELIAHLWNLAAAQGQGEAMFGLGFMYRAGDGVPKDLKKSAAMFTRAANLGHPGAQYELGLMYKYGRGGVSKNAAKAGEYLKKASDAGVPQARQELSKK
ncbi:sel1 repeat family protein [Desulfovibrio sp. OttesenSCG-928-O18]|nr:sel1 repeat family protein [Desulfovibrio sp. OttesenSCG-928-O18]